VQTFGSIQDIADKVRAGERLSYEDGVRLYKVQDPIVLGSLAAIVRERLNGKRVYYSLNLHLNHTNVCNITCMFCAFSRLPGEAGGYTFTTDEIVEKVRGALQKWNINEVHIVGGHHPDLMMDYYLEMMQKIRALSSTIYIKAFTAPEIYDFATRFGMSTREVLKQLKEAGLDGLLREFSATPSHQFYRGKFFDEHAGQKSPRLPQEAHRVLPL